MPPQYQYVEGRGDPKNIGNVNIGVIGGEFRKESFIYECMPGLPSNSKAILPEYFKTQNLRGDLTYQFYNPVYDIDQLIAFLKGQDITLMVQPRALNSPNQDKTDNFLYICWRVGAVPVVFPEPAFVKVDRSVGVFKVNSISEAITDGLGDIAHMYCLFDRYMKKRIECEKLPRSSKVLSPLLDGYGFKDGLISDEAILQALNNNPKKNGRIEPDNKLLTVASLKPVLKLPMSRRLYCNRGGFTKLGFYLGFDSGLLSGSFTLKISLNGDILRTERRTVDRVKEGEYLVFEFDVVKYTGKELYSLKFEGEGNVSIYGTSPLNARVSRLFGFLSAPFVQVT